MNVKGRAIDDVDMVRADEGSLIKGAWSHGHGQRLFETKSHKCHGCNFDAAIHSLH
jgi:hypothetical protein